MKKLLFIASLWLLLVVALIAGLSLLPDRQPPVPAAAAPALNPLLNTDNEGFAEVEPGRPLQFPADHGAHPDFRTETWYFNAYLQTPATNRKPHRFGFQLTFFRIALAPRKPPIESAWAAHQVYRAHLAITALAPNRFYAYERFSRAALDLAGAKTSPVEIWLENWRMRVSKEETSAQPVFQLSAQTDEISINLKLVKRKPVIPGFNITGGTQPFHAYLLPRLRTRGELTIGDESFDVSGDGWLDHAWGLVPLGRGQLGQLALNRFVVRLDDDRELLIFQLRRRDGSGQPLHSGLLIAPDGTTKALRRRDIVLETTRHWHSENSRIRYPAGWRLKLENADLTLAITPLIDDQELDLSLRYWAGAVTVAGQSGGGSVSGSGHVELTGYEP